MGKHLVAFALVAEEFERTGDPIKGLKPLFAPLLRGKSGQEFDPASFAGDFTSLYGLQMTSFVGRALAERLTETGLLVRSYDPGSGERFHIADFEWDPELIHEHQVEQTIELFVAWGLKQAEETEFGFSERQLEDAILSRLSRPEFASIFTRAAEDKAERLKGMLGIAALDVNTRADAYLDYLVARFIYEAAVKAPDVFGAISQIAYGSLIADAVAGLAVPPSALSDSLLDLKVVLDGPLVLDLLDLNSREHKAYADGLLEIIQGSGINVAIFEHSVDEMVLTINATLAADDRREGFGPMAHRFRSEQGQRAYAVLVRDSLKRKVEGLGIEILAADHYRSAAYMKFFSEERLDEIRNSIGDLHEHVDARARDAESIAAVARIKGVRARAESLFEAGVIFITRNSVLCKRVLRTLSRGYAEPTPRFTVATDGQLAGVLWFIRGIEGLSLSRKRLIANCSAAILPKREVVARIAGFLENVRPELKESFEVMMADSRASLCMMRVTGGDVDSIDEAKALDVVEEMRRELAAPAIERAEAAERELQITQGEVERLSADSKGVAAVLQANIEELEGRRVLDAQDFEMQIAQFQLDMDVASREIGAARQRDAERRAEILKKISIGRNRLRIKVDIGFRFLEIVFVVFLMAAAFTEFFGVLGVGYLAKTVGLLSSIFTIGVIEIFLKEKLKKFVGWWFSGDSRYIEGLEAALSELD